MKANTWHRLQEIVHVASLTNHELCVYLWVQLKKSIAEDNLIQHWFVSTEDGSKSFFDIAHRVATLEMLPSEMRQEIQRNSFLYNSSQTNENCDDNNDEGDDIIVNPSRTSRTANQIITETAHQLSDVLFTSRLVQVVKILELDPEQQQLQMEMIGLGATNLTSTSNTTTTTSTTIIPLSQMARLIQASTYPPTKPQLQHRIISILWKQFYSLVNKSTILTSEEEFGSVNVFHTIASVQFPILEKLDPNVWMNMNWSMKFRPPLTNQYSDDIDVNENIKLKVHENITGDMHPLLDTLLGQHEKTFRGNFMSWKINSLVKAASLARRGNQIGSKHGCVIVVPRNVLGEHGNDIQSIDSSFAIVGRGWNHNILSNKNGGKKRMVHAEVHAVADTIRTFGESIAFQDIFPNAVVIIVELKGETSYENAPPCPKCQLLLRAMGIYKTCYSTDRGVMEDMDLPISPSSSNFFVNPIVHVPLRAVCDEMGIPCSKINGGSLGET